MAGTRKLGKPTDQRMAMLNTLVTDLVKNGKVVTTEPRAKEVKAMADSIIALAVKEHKNFEEVNVKVSKAKIDSNGRKVTEKVTSKNGKEYNRVVRVERIEKRQKDNPSRLHARREIMKKINKVEGVDLLDKLFNVIAPQYEGRIGGYTRILKMQPRRGDNADVALLQLV